jgi:hypothetical protein
MDLVAMMDSARPALIAFGLKVLGAIVQVRMHQLAA